MSKSLCSTSERSHPLGEASRKIMLTFNLLRNSLFFENVMSLDLTKSSQPTNQPTIQPTNQPAASQLDNQSINQSINHNFAWLSRSKTSPSTSKSSKSSKLSKLNIRKLAKRSHAVSATPASKLSKENNLKSAEQVMLVKRRRARQS